ncbi:hypothetical protein [Saccharomonospora sp. CUA-673]|uniref:hypothetical protein n=1 Tax=Saccharomonospora sp. CUA-673 TaxID=1904969 RepID=UPI00130173FB|nr:hypothetical protein [Saccharomonospora sp. CUA-673]
MSAAIALVAAPAAFAAQDITVTNPNEDGSVSASADGSTLSNVDSGTDVTCSSSSGEGEIPSGSHTAPAPIGDLSVSFDSCTGPLGSVSVTPNAQPYQLHIGSYDSASGVSTGWVGEVNASISTLTCSFDAVGNAPGEYDNATGQLTVTPDVALPDGVAPLEATNTSGCLGLVSDGDALTLEAVYDITDPATPITIG